MSQETIERADAKTKAIIEKLRARRLAVNMSQDTLGRAVDLDRMAINKIEHGKRNLLFSEFYAITQVLGIDPRQLIVEAHNER